MYLFGRRTGSSCCRTSGPSTTWWSTAAARSHTRTSPTSSGLSYTIPKNMYRYRVEGTTVGMSTFRFLKKRFVSCRFKNEKILTRKNASFLFLFFQPKSFVFLEQKRGRNYCNVENTNRPTILALVPTCILYKTLWQNI